ncbi:hypothetical protein BRADI_4g03650v3 [Brachypodium distachyon]|uniref:Protein kinase domain-containing protein n=1 Tax=Brachypodium distachyon TaxID=15368 RepID=A0A0Q3EEN3_BRADI|nr:hypothetical protein BRADI_4g03650v3 [Brachypodium distachyon]
MKIQRTRQLLILYLLTLILLFLTSSSQPTNNGTANSGDLSVLLSFKSFTRDPTHALSSWSWDHAGNSTSTKVPGFCKWRGVACSDRRHPGRVTAIRLQGFGLAGTIFPQLGNLTHLRVLDLSMNNLEGDIPGSLSGCAALRGLDLGVNYLSGSMPSSMGLLSKLIFLNVTHNNLTGDIPLSFSNLTALTKLSLQSNNFHGQISRWLGNLTSLTHLDLTNNGFSGHISPALVFRIGFNQLSGSLPLDVGFRLPKLIVFSTPANQFEGSIPASFSNASALTYFILHGNRYYGLIPRDIGIQGSLRLFSEILRIPSLTLLLNLSNNALTGSIPTQIGHLNSLVGIDISMNRLSGEIPDALGSCVLLNSLYLRANLLQGIIPKAFSSLRGLGKLDLSSNNLVGPVPEFLESFELLTYLNLSFNNLSGPVPNTGSHQASQYQRRVILFCMVGTLMLFMCSLTACYFMKTRTKTNTVHQETGFHNEKHERISYAEIDAATNSFSPANLIGSGTFGNVYIGTLSLDDSLCTVAVKVLNLGKQGANRSFLRECEALRKIRHRKLVKVITVCSSLDHNGDEFKALVLKFICNGNLDEWLHPNTMTNDDDIGAHVTDFGLAKIMCTDASKQSGTGAASSSFVIKGTIGYVAPEYGSGSETSTAGDIYSYGVLLLEMFTGKRPTDSFINGATSLVDYVKMAYPDKLLEILDATATYSGSTQHIMDIFLYPMFKLGLACCEDSPSRRMKMNGVVNELNSIKKAWAARPPVHEFRASA